MNPRLGQFGWAGQATLAEQRSEVLSKPGYGVFSTNDGGHVAIGALEDHFWTRLKNALSLDQFERSEEHTSELQSLMRISYAVFCLQKTKQQSIMKTKIH